MGGPVAGPSGSGGDNVLTEEQIAEYRQAFDEFDVDGSGSLEVDEVRQMLTSLGKDISPEELQELFSTIDTNGDNVLSFDEFVRLLESEVQASQTERYLRETFNMFDPDGDGYVSADRLKTAIQGLGCGFTDEELDEMVELVDTNGTGEIFYEGILDLMSFENETLLTAYRKRSRIEKKEKDESSQEEQAVEQPEQKKKSVKKKERKAPQTDQTSVDQKKNIGKGDKNSTKPVPRPKYMGHKAVAPKLRKSAPCKTQTRPIVLPPPTTHSTLNRTQNKTTKPKMPYDEWKRLKQQQQQRTSKQAPVSNAKGDVELKELKQDAPGRRRPPSPRGQQYFSLWRTAFIDALDKLKENKIRSIVLTTPDIVEADRKRKSNDAKKRAWRPRQFDTLRSVEDIRSERSGSPEVIKFRGSYTKRHRTRLALETSTRQQLEQVQRVVAANLARASQSTGDQQLSERRSEIITRSGLKRIRKVRA